MTKKNSEMRDMASTWQSDKKASNLVSIFYVIDKSLTHTTCSTSDLLFNSLICYMYIYYEAL